MGKRKERPLWAPWRIEFIRSKKTDSCFLCRKNGEIAAENEIFLVAEGKKAFVILNRFPYNSGHVMVAPYRHTGDISQLEKDELNEMMEMTVSSKNLLSDLMCPDGFNIGFNLGSAAGAGLEEHIHLHIVPRWIGDTNFMPVIGNTRVVPESLRETAALLRKAWKNTDSLQA